MATKTIESLGSAKSVLVICGEKHRAGLAARLADHGLRVESRRFPERCEDEAAVLALNTTDRKDSVPLKEGSS
jgi:uroporphyrinogen-III synthase